MEIPMGLKKVAVLCVLRCGDKFLLLKRNKDPHKNMHTPVGGKLEPFEEPEKAVKREVLEETGININNVGFFGILTETSPVKFNWINYIYVSDIEYIDPPLCNEGVLEWIDVKNLEKLNTPKTDYFIYEYVKEKKIFIFEALYNENIELLKLIEKMSGKGLV